MKAAMLAAGHSSPWKLFPDYILPPDTDKEEAEAIARGDDIDYDFSDVEWEMPTENGQDPTEMLELLNTMGANLSLSVGDDNWEPEPLPTQESLLDQALATDESEREWL